MSGIKTIDEYFKVVGPKLHEINNQRNIAIMQEQATTRKRIADAAALEKAKAIQERTKQRRLATSLAASVAASLGSADIKIKDHRDSKSY